MCSTRKGTGSFACELKPNFLLAHCRVACVCMHLFYLLGQYFIDLPAKKVLLSALMLKSSDQLDRPSWLDFAANIFFVGFTLHA